MILIDEGKKLTREEVLQYGKQMKVVFPEEYINFLLISNGGTPEEDLVFDFIDKVSNKKNCTDVREFYVFYTDGDTSYDDIVKVNTIMKSEGQISNEYFVIADDSAGNPICIKTEGNDKGSVFLCDHELEDAESGFLFMSKIADSFDEFINLLYVLED